MDNEELDIIEESIKDDFDNEILQLSLFLLVIFYIVLISSVKLEIFPKTIQESHRKIDCTNYNLTSLSNLTNHQTMMLIDKLLRIHDQPLILYMIGSSNNKENMIRIGKVISEQSTLHHNHVNALYLNDHHFKENLLSKINNNKVNPLNGCYSNIFIILINKSQIRLDPNWQSNLEWLESAMDETKPVLHTHKEDIDTSNWGFIFIESVDHIDDDDNFMKNNSVGKMVSDRWSQRIKQTIIIR